MEKRLFQTASIFTNPHQNWHNHQCFTLKTYRDLGARLKSLRQLIDHRELLYLLTKRDITVRYKQSVMGVLWAILMPILIVGAGALVRYGFATFAGKAVSHEDILSVVVRAIVWAFVMSSIRFGTSSLLANTNLVSKAAFPKEVFAIGAVLSSLFDFAVAAVAAMLVLLIFGDGLSIHALLALPLMLIAIALVTGLVLILSSLNLFYRDVKYLVEIVLSYAIFFTPVLYSASMFGRWESLIMANPVAPLLEGLSDVLVDHRMPSFHLIGYSAFVAFSLLIFGYWLFKRLEITFAERI